MATLKTYFVFPHLLEYFKNAQSVAGLAYNFGNFRFLVDGTVVNPNTSILTNLTAFTDGEVSNCNSDFTTCAIGGTANSFNPFKSFLSANYSESPNGVARGRYVNRVGTQDPALANIGLGFDQLEVEINTSSSGGSDGTTEQGAFFCEYDPEKKFSFYILFSFHRDPLGGTNYTEKYLSGIIDFEYDPVGNFRYLINTSELLPQPIPNPFPTSSTSIAESAFLDGDGGGWSTEYAENFSLGPGTRISFDFIEPSPPVNEDPIVTQSISMVASSTITPSIVSEDKYCCYFSPVLASTTSSLDWENDINGFLFKRNFSSETIDLFLEKNGGASAGGTDHPLNDASYGDFYDFGGFSDYPNYKAYQIQWKKVLQALGEGAYQVRIEYNSIVGLVETKSVSFRLKEYTAERANGTFRMQSIQNGYLKEIDIDFTGLNWKDGIRVEGFFGNRIPEYTDERIVYTNDEAKQLRSEKIDKYILQTMFVPHCVTSRIVDYHNFANYLYLTDYNSNNHRKDYVNHRVIIDSMDSFEYNSSTDKAKLEITYKDFLQNGRKINC